MRGSSKDKLDHCRYHKRVDKVKNMQQDIDDLRTQGVDSDMDGAMLESALLSAGVDPTAVRLTKKRRPAPCAAQRRLASTWQLADRYSYNGSLHACLFTDGPVT